MKKIDGDVPVHEKALPEFSQAFVDFEEALIKRRFLIFISAAQLSPVDTNKIEPLIG